MIRRIRKIFRYGLIIFLLMIVSTLAVFAISTAPKWGDALLRIEVRDGRDEVSVSVPLSCLKTAFTIMPKEIRKLCEELDLDASSITDELKTMNGEDLVRITGDENIRIWVEPVSMKSTAGQGFVKVHVKEGGHHGSNINIWVPRGLVTFAGTIVRLTGIVDRYVELPPEIANLKCMQQIHM